MPTLRFPGFTEEWQCESLSEYFTFKNGLNPDAKRIGKGVKFISVMDILSNEFITNSNIRNSVEATAEEMSVFGVHYGDILFQRSSETLEDVGRANVYLDNEMAVYGGFVIRGMAIKEYNPIFMRYALAAPCNRKKIIVKGAGAQHFNIGQDGLSKVNISLPKITEQKKIGKLLSLIDERIATQNKIIERLESLITGINNLLDSRFGHEQETSFGEIAVDYNGLSGKSSEDFGNGFPYISYVQVNANIEIEDTVSFSRVKIDSDESQNIVRNGDLLVTLSSETPEEVAVCASYHGCMKPLYLNSFCFGLHFKHSAQIYEPYFSFFTSTNRFRRFVFPLAQGSTRYNLHKLDFMKNRISLPYKDNQERIYIILKCYLRKKDVEKSVLDNLLIQKQFLLNELFI